MVIKSSTDSVLKDSYKDGQPLMMPLQKGQFKGSFQSGLAHIGEGDSTTVLVSATVSSRHFERNRFEIYC